MLSRKMTTKSLRFRLTIGTLLVFIPLLFFLVYSNLYSISVIKHQVSRSRQNMIALYLEQIDLGLSNVSNYLNSMVASDEILVEMLLHKDDDQHVLTKVALSNKLGKDILQFRNIDGLFVIDSEYGDNFFALGVNTTYADWSSLLSVISPPDGVLMNSSGPSLYQWSIIEAENRKILLRAMKTENIFIGAWVDVRRLSVPLTLLESENSTSLITTEKGEIVTSYGGRDISDIVLSEQADGSFSINEDRRYLVVGQRSKLGNFNLMAVIPNEEILENLPAVQVFIFIFILLSLLLLPVWIVQLRALVFLPVNKILAAINKVKEGIPDARIQAIETTDEFRIIDENFNEMLEEIKKLKINVYEEKLRQQEFELEFLQLQVNPHFFLNSLNIIYRLAENKNFTLIKEMSLCLLKYFRYMFQGNQPVVSLKDELEHTLNYIRIQELRFPEKLVVEVDIDDDCLDACIPPGIIQSFAENSVKYAVSLDEIVTLKISASYRNDFEKRSLVLLICDDGVGFDDEILDKIRSGELIIDMNGEHIGIKNIRRRLRILYNGEAELNISQNTPHGARIEVIFPAEHRTVQAIERKESEKD